MRFVQAENLTEKLYHFNYARIFTGYQYLLIASTALSNQLILVTDNIKHFDRIEGISIENWIVR